MKQFLILVAILLFVVAFGDLHVQYGFYQLLRWVVCISAVISAINFKGVNNSLFVIFCVVAIVFNPILPLYFDKDAWKVIDVIAGIVYGYAGFKLSTAKID